MTLEDAPKDVYPQLLAGIGAVALNSGWASMALQQFAEALTGSTLVQVMLGDRTFGHQVAAVREVVRNVEPVTFPVPQLNLDMLQVGTHAIDAMSELVKRRNRVVHDVWTPEPAPGCSDGVLGHRATQWGREIVRTNVRTFHSLGSSFFLVACVLGSAQHAINLLRSDEEGGPLDDHAIEVRGYHRDLQRRMAEIDAGTLPGWRWETATAR